MGTLELWDRRKGKLGWDVPCFHKFKMKCRRFGGMAKKRWESRVNSGIINLTKEVWISSIFLSKLHSHVASDDKVNSILQRQRQKWSQASAASSEEALSQATVSYYGSKTSTALKSHSSHIMDSKTLHKLICPSMKWSRGEKNQCPYLAISTQLYSFQSKHHLSRYWNSPRRMSLFLSFHFQITKCR